MMEIPPRRSVKVLGWFFYVDLLTKRKNECKQRHKKYAESQHILEIKAISHRHHLHSIKNERSAHPATRLLLYLKYYHIISVISTKFTDHLADQAGGINTCLFYASVLYCRYKRSNRPQGGLTLLIDGNSTPSLGQSFGVVFLCRPTYKT